MSRINLYLKKIDAGSPVNLNTFHQILPKQYQHRLHDLFAIEKVSKFKWHLTPKNLSIYEQLKAESVVPTSRVDAAKRGNSHLVRVDFAPLLLRTAHNGELTTVVFCKDQQHETENLEKTGKVNSLLVIENRALFFQLQQTFEALNYMTNDHWDIKDWDVAMGEGNGAANQLFMPFYQRYERCAFLLDYDLGGLTTYSGIERQCPNTNFVLPDNAALLKECFLLSPESDNRLASAIKTAEKYNFLPLVTLFRHTKQFMEQEMLLTLNHGDNE
ncbi:hypothetical protein L4D77_14215 [Photobacterium frigidiphilum]|uniref:hypothetical protein n=1 Tax=Photobacterium frigidiphilum TaxID=264736 RepID=UPI003D0AA5D7